MRIVYLANYQNLESRMHKVSWLKLKALEKHPDFTCLNICSVPSSTLGRIEYWKLVRDYQPDVIVHDALWGVGVSSIMVSGLIDAKMPRVLMVEDYEPFIPTLDLLLKQKQFTHFICIPLVAKQNLPNSYWLGHYIPEWFDDYGIKKDLDVLFYGQTGGVYQFRTRLHNLFAKQKDLRFFAVPPRNHKYDGAEYVGEHLARTINRAHLTIACTSTADYMVKKYLEVPACKSTVIGNVNEECRLVYPNNEGIIEVSPSESDAEILEKAHKFLEKPKPSQKAYEIARSRNPDAYAKRLRKICGKILEAI